MGELGALDAAESTSVAILRLVQAAGSQVGVEGGEPPDEVMLTLLVSLPETDVVNSRLASYTQVAEEAVAAGRRPNDRVTRLVASWTQEQALALVRDDLKAQRQALGPAYASCWCLGLGGREMIAIAMRGEDGEVYNTGETTWRYICGCPDGADAARAREASIFRTRHTAEMHRRERILGAARIPERYQTATVESWLQAQADAHPNNRDVAAQIRRTLGYWWQNAWSTHDRSANTCLTDMRLVLVLSGGYGTGKTTVASALAQMWITKGGEALFRQSRDLFAELHELYTAFGNARHASQWEVVQALGTSGLLVLDDLGAEKLTDRNEDWLVSTLEGILDQRLNHMLPTIITTNLSPKELWGQVGDRVCQRLLPDGISYQAEFGSLTNLRGDIVGEVR